MSTKVTTLQTLINSWNTRPSWDEYFMSMALMIASRSSCERLHVGCVLVKDNRVISAGYNGFLANVPHISCVVNDSEQNTVHAEQNCIADCASRGISTNGAIAYITHFPCINCTKILCASDISKIIYLDDYKNNPLSTSLLLMKGVGVYKLPTKPAEPIDVINQPVLQTTIDPVLSNTLN
jgi:dCMP deaminase